MPHLTPGDFYDVMTPVTTPTQDNPDKTTWAKAGTAFVDESGEHLMRISLLTIPVGAVAPLRLFVYPKREERSRGR